MKELIDQSMKNNINMMYHNISCKLVAKWSCIVVVFGTLHDLHTYTISHMMSCVCCNSCNSSDNIYVVRIC